MAITSTLDIAIRGRISHYQERGNDHDGHAVALEEEGPGVLVHLPLEIQSVDIPYTVSQAMVTAQ